ncbi:O-antigen ligase family protein [Polaribacter sp.]|nr:O-antigen ligase family protein [Polaribacter sp.]
MKKLEISLSLLVFPLVFALIWRFKELLDYKFLLKTIVLVFFHSVVVFAVIVFSYLLYVGGFSYLSEPSFIRHFTEYLPFIGQHSIYASIYLGLGLLCFIYLLKLTKKIKYQVALILEASFILLLLISLASKGALLASFVSIIVYCLSIINKKRNQLVLLISFFALLFFILNFSPSLSKRVSLFNASLSLPSYEGELSSTQTRKEIYNCSFKLLKSNWIYGYGFGDVNDKLIICYSHVSKYLVDGEFNSHNQYLSILLGCGVFGLFTTLLFLYFNYEIFKLEKHYFFISVLLFYSIIMFVENILERQSGVILFSFFINLFSFCSYNKNFR